MQQPIAYDAYKLVTLPVGQQFFIPKHDKLQGNNIMSLDSEMNSWRRNMMSYIFKTFRNIEHLNHLSEYLQLYYLTAEVFLPEDNGDTANIHSHDGRMRRLKDSLYQDAILRNLLSSLDTICEHLLQSRKDEVRAVIEEMGFFVHEVRNGCLLIEIETKEKTKDFISFISTGEFHQRIQEAVFEEFHQSFPQVENILQEIKQQQSEKHLDQEWFDKVMSLFQAIARLPSVTITFNIKQAYNLLQSDPDSTQRILFTMNAEIVHIRRPNILKDALECAQKMEAQSSTTVDLLRDKGWLTCSTKGASGGGAQRGGAYHVDISKKTGLSHDEADDGKESSEASPVYDSVETVATVTLEEDPTTTTTSRPSSIQEQCTDMDSAGESEISDDLDIHSTNDQQPRTSSQ